MAVDDDRYFVAEVREASRLTPNMIRLVFGGRELAAYASSGRADERLVIEFPASGGTLRSYTVRCWDPVRAELTVDVVAHAGGVASTWAEGARPGDQVRLSDARGWYLPPQECSWQLLVADMTGLPALGRIVEELDPGVRAHVIVEVLAVEDIQELSSRAEVSYDWRIGRGNGMAPSVLPEVVQEFAPPSGPGYLWFAAEAEAARAVRRHVRRVWKWPHAQFTILGYWRHRQEEWRARYDQHGAELMQVYTKAIAEGRSSHDALELYDEALARVGL